MRESPALPKEEPSSLVPVGWLSRRQSQSTLLPTDGKGNTFLFRHMQTFPYIYLLFLILREVNLVI